MEQTRAALPDVRLLGKHQLAALLGTSADFGAMIALVELAAISPPIATLTSAAVGGVTNFVLARGWAFRGVHNGSVHGQALRYAVASAGGALANAGLLAALLSAADLPYLFARGLVSAFVSVAYSYPVHARFVFRVSGEDEDAS